ncbi:hypothetical protein ACW9KT_20585 [Hymenobacter sp. HD11105]
MKSYFLIPLLVSGLFISCSKEKVSPSRQMTTLGDSTWRMTAYTFDLSAKNGAAKITHDFFKSFSPNSSTPCLGKSTITFDPSSKVTWSTEPGACALNISDVWGGGQTIEWGTWKITDDQSMLFIGYDRLGAGVSALPTVQAVTGSYTIIQMNQVNLVLDLLT